MSETRASWTRRFFAYLVDNIIVEVIWIGLILILGLVLPIDIVELPDFEFPENNGGNLFAVEATSDLTNTAFTYATVFPFRFIYWVYYEYKRGQTIGKRMLQVRTVKIDGSNQDFIDVVILTFFKTSLIPFDVLLGVLFLRGKKERISNRLTNTIVVSV
jgi:uncharacterized RDD family membrane protein YckC